VTNLFLRGMLPLRAERESSVGESEHALRDLTALAVAGVLVLDPNDLITARLTKRAFEKVFNPVRGTP
jgi:hypothetical protein